MKKTGVALRNRIIAAPSVESWARRIEGLEREVAEVMREEREERALRKAEQEATKVLALPRCLVAKVSVIHLIRSYHQQLHQRINLMQRITQNQPLRCVEYCRTAVSAACEPPNTLQQAAALRVGAVQARRHAGKRNVYYACCRQ